MKPIRLLFWSAAALSLACAPVTTTLQEQQTFGTTGIPVLEVDHSTPPPPPRPTIVKLYVGDDLKRLSFEGMDPNIEVCVPAPMPGPAASCAPLRDVAEWIRSRHKS